MKVLVMKAGIVGVGDRIGILDDGGHLVFRRVSGNYSLPDEMSRSDKYVPSPETDIKIEDGPRLRYLKKARVLVGVNW